ncbi:MAG: hypothetical protein CVT49_00575 [candidate division Zixibacteria bacterium HGW-Zixibacteria-1]|nr:MAG: hypothetical protein CVT49_00575 [candidate division Zixibacteria bacterium HGW-Zixibacteria-1]
MIVVKKIVELSVISILLIFIFTPRANAYIDPSSGSYFIQILMAGVLGGIFAVKMSFGRIRERVSRLRRRDKAE